MVSRSSNESEYRALSDTAVEVIWIQSLLQRIGIQITHKPVNWCDNKSVAAIASNVVYHARTKHIEIDTHFVRDKVQKKELDVCHVPTDDQIADIFTKHILVVCLNHLLESFPIEKG